MALSNLRWVYCLFAIVSALSHCGNAEGPENRTNLTIMLIISYGQFGFNSSGGLPAAEMALEDINNKPDLLPGYNLVYDSVRDSQCHRTISLDTFFEGILSDPVKLAVVGCGCSVATTPVAEISHKWNISQISYASGSPALSDRARFKKYFRINSASAIIAPTLRSIMIHFNWSRVAIITQEESFFTSAEALIRSEFEMHNITVNSRTFKTEDDPILTEDLFIESEDYRVIMINSYSGPARKIICEAYKRNYTYPRYVWGTYYFYPRYWWTQNTNNVEVDCTDEELRRFLERTLTIQSYESLNDENTTTDTGIVFGDFEREYERRALEGRFNIIERSYHNYDAIWALALALNRTMTMVNESDISGTGCEMMNGSLVPLHEFDYSNALMGCLIQWNLQRTNFSGVVGRVSFDENGTLIQTRTTLNQYQFIGTNSLVRNRIAYLEEASDFKFSFLSDINDSVIYPDGTPPDGTPQQITNTFELWLVSVFYILTTFGIAFAVVCLLFNLLFRKRKLIKISSPNLNYFIITGAILMYVSIYFYLLPVTNSSAVQARCIIEHWLFTIGYSLAFGTVLAKMWRVYQIFNNPKLNIKGVKDWHILILIFIITGFAVLLLILESAVPHLRGSVTRERDQEHPSGKTPLNVTIEFYVMVCYEETSPNFFWQIFIFVYLAVLQIIGIVLAFQTRRVKLHGLRDSKYIAAIIYISSIVLVVLALVSFSLRTFNNIGTGIFALGILIFTTIFLSLIFIPKMVMLYQDPNGEAVGTTPSLEATPRFITNQSNMSENDRVTLLEREMREKENKINELTLEINALKGTQNNNEGTQNNNRSSWQKK